MAHFSVFLLPSWPSVPRSALSIRELKTSSGRPRVPTPLNHGMKKNGVVGGGWGLGDIAINSRFIAVQDHVAQHYEAVRLGEGGMAV